MRSCHEGVFKIGVGEPTLQPARSSMMDKRVALIFHPYGPIMPGSGFPAAEPDFSSRGCALNSGANGGSREACAASTPNEIRAQFVAQCFCRFTLILLSLQI